MTAVVGILNKRAIAIAADSASTVQGTNSRKILNDSTKIFTLSKFHPVGIMIHNNASFLSTPLETIIKLYRKQLGNKSFPTLEKYQEDFIKFLHDKNFYSNDETQKVFMFQYCNTIIDSIVKQGLKDHKDLLAIPTDENKEKAIKLIEQHIDELLVTFKPRTDFFSEFTDYTLAEFDSFSQDLFNELIKYYFTGNALTVNSSFTEKLKELLFLCIKCKDFWSNNFTGLTFVGFGEDEIYPALIPINIYLAVGTRLRYYILVEKEVHISNSRQSGIVPFAQTDVIDTILTGIDPTLAATYTANIDASLTNFHEKILKIVDGTPALKSQVEAIDIKLLVKEFDDKIQESKLTTYINPMFSALDSLSKEDLAEMAESLIYLTYLKRRITFAEESVGGPVDVAIISKGDGFIWIKRKFYFKPELNKYFFDNYLK